MSTKDTGIVGAPRRPRRAGSHCGQILVQLLHIGLSLPHPRDDETEGLKFLFPVFQENISQSGLEMSFGQSVSQLHFKG